MLNEAQNSIFDLFTESFKVGNGTSSLLNHMVVLALDQGALEHCESLNLHCYFPNYANNFESRENRETTMMKRQIEFSKEVLQLGYNFIYTDLDVVWFRNPLRHFNVLSQLILATEFYRGEESLENSPNGAFMYVLSTTQSIEFFRSWQFTAMRYVGGDRRTILTRAVREGAGPFRLNLQFLDTDYFGDFCRRGVDLSKVVAVRAGWCCDGRAGDLGAARALAREWKNYASLPVERKGSSFGIKYECRS
ncbi:uncharacterized protein At4g15970-like [Zingiber officinale]|uniref:Nucleotide-diphospho-sugar transferase domain-containing protein n=1 Tax=Zingiber officinale TaxID=94328 RepID=A0A8J5LF30_ZINOF|nr:uncharacterized protein At4g15970-like [Zingiber officinale]KAG6515599.1 hypothetical protein ZIOFF_026028 [Zingiber officinale]